ncbi:hypothetical protein [Candidatus Binatus sp.]|uniref:hypothetical protein n=1 Tax=Candidatus Binatus sp. TaxID=2811406 RepID=UPI003CC667A7
MAPIQGGMIEPKPSKAILFLRQKFEELLTAAELCVHNKLATPALILVYSGIDVAGWLYASNPAEQTNIRFVAWVNRYLLHAGAALEVSALELYGARCGLLHNFSSESDLSRKDGDIRKVHYAWGNSRAETLIEMARLAKLDGQNTAINVGELISAFRTGLTRFFEEATADPKIAQALETRWVKVFGTMSEGDAQELLEWGKSLLANPLPK